MANTKTTDLTATTSVAAGDILYIIDSGSSKQISYSNLTGGATSTELGYVSGVTSAIQTQMDLKAPLASPTFTGTVTLPTGLTGVLRADSGVVSTDSDVTDLVSAASTTAAGKVELATTAETTTGTDATRAVTPAGLAGAVLTLATPKINTSINDTNGNEIIKTPATASAINEITVTNAAIGNAPEISATGDDTNIDLELTGKGTGTVLVHNNVACRAYLGSAQNAVSGGVKVALDTENYDLGSDFDTDNNRFVAPVTGYYQVNATVGTIDVTAGSQIITQIYVNEALYSQTKTYSTANTDDLSASLSDLVYAEAGQYIELYTACTTTEPMLANSQGTFMSIHLVSV